ncbi:MAG: hypothetical protein AAGK32_16305, partial [Actinomycetota bacterium]
RVVFLDGERGTGKTTVAATLRSYLSSDADAPALPDEKPYADLKANLTHVKERLILLDTLGMENAPKDTNVLAALLARIEHKLFPNLADDGDAYAGSPGSHDAVLKLLRLQTDVALAWNGNLEKRMGQLDPDNYAMEELRVERVRLQLRARFSSALRSVARDSLRVPKPSLFLLLVDDVDLNPDQVVELLDRLRMVGVAEFAVLLVGDLEVLSAVFRMEYAAKFKGGGRGDVVPSLQHALPVMTDGLALAALRKHVPARQRVRLRLPTLQESKDLVPLRHKEGGKKLGKLLDGRHVWLLDPAAKCRRLSLDDLMGRDRSAGSQVLIDNARSIVDLWNVIDSLEESDQIEVAAGQEPAAPGQTRADADANTTSGDSGGEPTGVGSAGGTDSGEPEERPMALTRTANRELRSVVAIVGAQRLLR